MMLAFSPELLRALAGGALIGLAAAMLVLLNGRIAGISGILGGVLRPVRSELGWRVAFLLGLVLSPLVFVLFAPLPTVHVEAGKASLIVGGVLVGLGTRYGAGCTSGHGVCGIARLSPRSLAATAAFMLAGFVTVFVLRHLAGSAGGMKHILTAFASGLVFGLGLILSGMTDPGKVIGFLDLAGDFNPALAFVMMGAIPVAAIAFRIVGKKQSTLTGAALHLPAAGKIDKRLLLGALTFGTGWGVAGYCPGPALASLTTGGSDALVFVGAMLGGMILFEVIETLRKPAA